MRTAFFFIETISVPCSWWHSFKYFWEKLVYIIIYNNKWILHQCNRMSTITRWSFDGNQAVLIFPLSLLCCFQKLCQIWTTKQTTTQHLEKTLQFSFTKIITNFALFINISMCINWLNSSPKGTFFMFIGQLLCSLSLSSVHFHLTKVSK